MLFSVLFLVIAVFKKHLEKGIMGLSPNAFCCFSFVSSYRETGEQGWKVFRQVNPLADKSTNQDLLQDTSVSLTWLWHIQNPARETIGKGKGELL